MGPPVMATNNYSYTPDDQYCYPGTKVLVNRFGIKDAQQLETAERKLTYLRITELMKQPPAGHFDLAHLRAIHLFIFQDIYRWAGKIRTGSFLQKGKTLFCLGQHIESFASDIHRQLKAENYLRGLEKNQFINRVAFYMGEINALHPFREGNGRTQRVYFHLLAKAASYNLDFDQVPHEELLAADIAAFDQDYTPLKEILERSLSPVES